MKTDHIADRLAIGPTPNHIERDWYVADRYLRVVWTEGEWGHEFHVGPLRLSMGPIRDGAHLDRLFDWLARGEAPAK